MITNVGINGNSTYLSSQYKYIAIGDGNTAPILLDTILENELDRLASTNTIITTTTLNDTAQFVAQFSFTSTESIKELGLFSESTLGDMFFRNTPSQIIVHDGYLMNVFIKIIESEE